MLDNKNTKLSFDEIERAEHYNQGDVECIYALESALTKEEFKGWLKGNIIKYTWREKTKGKLKDLEKTSYYLERLMESYEANSK